MTPFGAELWQHFINRKTPLVEERRKLKLNQKNPKNVERDIEKFSYNLDFNNNTRYFSKWHSN